MAQWLEYWISALVVLDLDPVGIDLFISLCFGFHVIRTSTTSMHNLCFRANWYLQSTFEAKIRILFNMYNPSLIHKSVV